MDNVKLTLNSANPTDKFIAKGKNVNSSLRLDEKSTSIHCLCYIRGTVEKHVLVL